MKVPQYRSQGTLIGRSGGVRNPVQIPFTIATAQAQSAQAFASGLNMVSEWAEKKQDLQDKVAATKATNAYTQSLDAFRNRLLFPKDEKDPDTNINYFKYTTKQREAAWLLGKKILAANIQNKFGNEISSTTIRSSLLADMSTIDTSQTTQFNTVINKRVIQENAAAYYLKSDDRTNKLSNPYLPVKEADAILAEQEAADNEAIKNGTQTSLQIKTFRDKQKQEYLQNTISKIADENRDEDGVINRTWIEKIKKEGLYAFDKHNHASMLWYDASETERREVIEELEEQRNDSITAANRERQIREQADEEAVFDAQAKLYDAPPGSQEAQDAFGELNNLTKNSDVSSNIISRSALEDARNHAFNKPATRFVNNEVFSRLEEQIRDFKIDEDGEVVSAVTREVIATAEGLTGEQRSKLRLQLVQLKDRRAVEGYAAIKNAAGLVEDVEADLFDKGDTEALTQLRVTIASQEDKWRNWVADNSAKNQGEFVKKYRELSDETRGLVGVLYRTSYIDGRDSYVAQLGREFQKNAELNPLSDSRVEGDITKLFNPQIRKDVLNRIINNDPDDKFDLAWLGLQQRQLNSLQIIYNQANKMESE